MKTYPVVWLAILLSVSPACARRTMRDMEPLTAAQVLREVHARYTGKRFTHVTFVQTTTHGDGRRETWYEALAPGGRVRVDIAPLSDRRGFIYRSDSQYVFRGGEVVEASGGQRWLSMLILLDLYSLPVDSTLARAAELGLRLGPAHTAVWQGRKVYVAGASAGDTLSPQVWYDHEHLYPVRLVQRALPDGPRYDWHIDQHVLLAGGWIERQIRIYSGDRLLVTETYDSIVPRPGLPDSLFLPVPYRPPAWLGRR